MLFLATSCLQGQTQLTACLALLRLHPDGLQLCPGNHPVAGWPALLARVDVPLRFHHGFCWDAYRAPVWSAAGELRVDPSNRSMHPPKTLDGDREPWLARAAAAQWVLEVMPPGWILSDEYALDAAMAVGVRLAVDVSHLHILRCAGRLSTAGLRRVLAYPHIAEVHVSDNDGRYDLHRPLSAETFGLGWARERAQAGVPLILECYMHRLDETARRQQRERFR